MKNMDLEYRKNPEKAKAANKAALELGVKTKRFQGTVVEGRMRYTCSLRFFDQL